MLGQRNRKVIMAGDFHGQVGTDGEGLDCHGGKGVANMINQNTCFEKEKYTHRYTYTSGTRKTQIDFILAK